MSNIFKLFRLKYSDVTSKDAWVNENSDGTVTEFVVGIDLAKALENTRVVGVLRGTELIADSVTLWQSYYWPDR